MDIQKKSAINNCLIGIKKRDDESLYKLYSLIGHTVKYIALKYLQDKSEAEDLEQDFWANIYDIADKFNYIGNAFNYLCKTMTRMALNRIAKLGVERSRVVEVVDYKIINSFDEDETIAAMDDKVAVQRAFDKLDSLEQKILQLTMFEDKTIVQIAKELKVSKSKVGRIKLMAREKLKNELNQYLLGKK